MNIQKKYYLIYKPYGMLSQFSVRDGRPTLSSLQKFPKDAYPVGRLDADSEGLLIITNDKSLTDYLLNPRNRHEREYLVQVEGIPAENDLQKLREGILLKDGKTLPAKIKLIGNPELPPRVPPIRERKNIPTRWLSITLIEGKNRQVRRMTAAIGYPTLRLVRVRIKKLVMRKLIAGEVKELSFSDVSYYLK